MPKYPKKFAVSWSVSVPKEMHEHGERIQTKWDKVAREKLGKRWKMSDVGVMALEIGLRAIEDLPLPTVIAAIHDESISEEVVKTVVVEQRKKIRRAKELGDMNEVEMSAYLSGLDGQASTEGGSGGST